MRKFLILIAAVFVMFAVPTTASAAPTATISGPAAATINQSLTYSAQVYSGGSGSIYATRPDNASFTCPAGIVTDSQGRRWCILNTFTYSTSGTASFTPRETGTYTIVANAYTNSTASFTASNSTECTGNPYTYNTSQWSDCGSSDNITLNVTPPTPTNFSASCPVPGSTANLSWNSSSGAGSYTVYGFDLAYGSPNWSQCGSNGMVVCQRVTTTSTSASNLTPRANYQWYVFACVGNTNTCSAAASTTATCTPPNCNTNLDCDLCSVPSNTCSTNNGTQTCYYRAYTGGGSCNVVSFNQSCTRSNCSSGYTCSSGSCIPPPPTPTIASNSCPAPGTTASVSWNGVSGASRYDVYAFDLSYGSPNWSACGQNGLVVCQQVTSGTSYSFSTTAGKQYQWFVNACNSAGCSPTATSTFTCTPPSCNTNLDCVLCGAPANTCSTNNGTQTCYYRAYTGGGSCNVVSFNQSCTINKCDSPLGYSCINGICTPPPPTASISAPSNNSSASVGQSIPVNATANGINLKSMDVYRIPSGADLSVASNWTWTAGNTNCGGASTCAVNSSWTPTAGETGQWIIAVNAFDNYGQNCSGMGSSGGFWTAACNRNGSTSNITVNIAPPPPTNPAASCPVPGSTANLSWTGVSGATRYDVFAFDLSYGSPNWSACGQNGLMVCQRVAAPSTSYSFSTTPGRNYQFFVDSCVGDGSNCSSTVSNNFTCLYNNAQYVSQSCPPSNMTPGQTASAWVIMNNNGNTTWPASSTYRLGSQNPQDNTTWGFGRIIPGSSIPPGSNYTFSSTVTAPSTPGTYNFQWRMVQEGVEWFGGTTPNCSVTVAYPPPRASVSGLSAATVGYTATFNANLTGSARSGQIWITKGDGRSTFSCPQGEGGVPYRATTGYYWCPVARQDNTTSLSGTYQFAELGTYTTVVNAFSNAYQAGTGPSDQCSGTPSSLGFNSATWSDCGASDTFTTTINRPPTPSGSVSASCIPEATISWANSDPAIIYVDISEDSNFSTFYNKYVAGTTSTSAPSGFNLYPGGTTPLILKPNTTYYLRSWNGYDISYPPSSFRTNNCPPRGSVSGPSAMVVGDNLTFSAALSGSARSGQIWITKGDGRSTFSCPQGEGGVPYRATTGYYWCPVARQDNTTSLSGTYQFAEPGSYTSVVNTFSNPYQLGTSPSDQCSGTPSSLGFDASKWSDCGANDNVVTINAAPRASVSGPSTIMRGETATYTATLSGGARSAALWITKGDGRSVFPCPTTIYYATTGRFWCNIGSGSGSTVTGTYPFVENGAYTVVVNAYANSNQTGTGPSDQCSGTPTDLGVNSDVWSDCGSSDNVATTATYGPAATLTGSSRGTKGSPSTFTATLLGSAQSAQIWITKGNGQSNFYCNGAENNASRASTGYYWCNIGSGGGSTVTGSYTFPDTDRYTAVVNAFTNSTTTYTANPSTECTGTPTYLGFNSTAWSDCGENDFIVITSSAPTATNCGGGTSPRAEGLVTSPYLETGSKFGTTTTGRCVVDSATEFSPFKIPSYEDLKFIYYTQSKATKTEITPSSGTANQGTLRSALNNYDTVLIRGNLNIGANLGGASKTAVVFVDGDLNIDTPTFTFGDASSGLVFVVGGNVIINRSVTRIDAVIISGRTIYTADGCSTRNSVDAEQLIVNGSLVSLDTGNIIFCRALSDNALPAEKINSDPKYLVILRDLYADIVQRWSEIP